MKLKNGIIVISIQICRKTKPQGSIMTSFKKHKDHVCQKKSQGVTLIFHNRLVEDLRDQCKVFGKKTL